MTRSVTPAIKKTVIFIHRWLGVALCVLFFTWFVSGIVMMYWDYPRVSLQNRLEHMSALDATGARLSLVEAYGRAALKRPPDQITFSMYDGRPAYRFRSGGQHTVVYADDGATANFSADQAQKAASQWLGGSTAQTSMDVVRAVVNTEDQWTVAGEYGALRPLYKFTWPSAEEVYVSAVTGEVVQHTTRGSRLGAYFGAIPHWLYFTPLRKDGALWTKVVIRTSAVATVAAFLGLVIGIWMYSPFKRYRHEGLPSSIPYQGQKRLHTILGLFFGLLAVTWMFSGMLSLDPFPIGGSEFPKLLGIQGALHGSQPEVAAFSESSPGAILAKLPADFKAKELEFTAFAGDPIYVARNERDMRMVTRRGQVLREFDANRILSVVKTAVEPDQIGEFRTVTEYEAYYIDRHERRPLPVLFVQLNDTERSMFYIDPKTARIVQSYDSGSRWIRWMYNGLHSLDLPWLYRHRPVWDIVMLSLLLGGVGLCVTSLIMGWQVIERKLRRTRGKDPVPALRK